MKRTIFSDGIAVGLVRCVFWPFEQLAGNLTGEKAEPLLDNPELGCSSGCRASNVVKGCPVHDRGAK